jgi:hypothetical protein
MLNEDHTTTTLIAYIGPSQTTHVEYVAAEIYFAEDFDINSLPKSVRAYPKMTITCTPTAKNAKNETGIKRLRRILKALEGRNVKVVMPYANSITEDEFFARYG